MGGVLRSAQGRQGRGVQAIAADAMTGPLEAASSEPSVRAPDQGRALSDAQRERYGAAIAALKSSGLGSDPKSFSAALDVAMHHCETARAFDWPERQVRERRREVAANWDAVNKAAMKLAVHFEKLDDRVGSARLAAALVRSGMKMKAQTKVALHLAFAEFLRALAKQPRPTDYEDQIGPLRIQKSSRKLPSREVALTVILAHLFDRVATHDGSCELKLLVGEAITSGSVWDVAALFAAAALGEDALDPNAAKKFLSDHRGHLYYQGWPEPEAV